MTNSAWRPTASIEVLRKRAGYLNKIRAFFEARDVLEVETPALCAYSVTDTHLEAMQTLHTHPGNTQASQLFLQTSPEFAMKRLLSAGSGCIYQISKSFRDDEVGKQHNPEFTMLEWYRVGFEMQALIDEVADLLSLVLECEGYEQLTYQQAFEQFLSVDPLNISFEVLVELAHQHGFETVTDSMDLSQALQTDRDCLLQLLFSHCIEPSLGSNIPCVVTHFPMSQAALAQQSQDNPKTSLRFEFYVRGIELANGYQELQDATVQKVRMEQDNRDRQALNKATKSIDPYLIDALQSGLPACSGVAMGIDRLMMLSMNKSHIRDVMAFCIDNA